MQTVNRVAAIVRPKQPYLDWFNSLNPEDGLLMAAMESLSTAILLPLDSYADQERFLQKIYEQIFKLELGAWGNFSSTSKADGLRNLPTMV